MKTEQQYYEEAKTIQVYMEEMSTHKEASYGIYKQFEIPTDGFVEKLKEANVHILAITEDWCGDAMLNNPIVRKVAEKANVEMRAALRDADTDLIDRYLTNGGRGIPIYLILDETGQVIATWGPRAPELQRMVEEGRAALPDKDHPNFDAATKAFYTNLTKSYAEDPQLWHYVYESFKNTLLQNL